MRPDLTPEVVLRHLEEARANSASEEADHFHDIEKSLELAACAGRELERHWNISADKPIASRGRLIDRPLVFIKRVVRRLLRWHINSFIDQQRYYNETSLQALGALQEATYALTKMAACTREAEQQRLAEQHSQNEALQSALRLSEETQRNLDGLKESLNAGTRFMEEQAQQVTTLKEEQAKLAGLFDSLERRVDEGEKNSVRFKASLEQLQALEELRKARDHEFSARLDAAFARVEDLKERLQGQSGLLHRQDEQLGTLNERLEELRLTGGAVNSLVQELEKDAAGLGEALQQANRGADERQRALTNLEQRLDEELTIIADRARRIERQINRGLHLPAEEATLERLAAADIMARGDFDYFLFENRHRGGRSEVKERQRRYLTYFQGRENVLDLGCGRGEFVELLVENKIGVTGIDQNEDLVAYARERGLPVRRADIFHFLQQSPEESFDGIFAAQVIEHLEPQMLPSLISLARQKLKPTGIIVLETINPRNITALAEWFFLDLTHTRPVHPRTLQFLLQAEGFATVELLYINRAQDAAIPHFRLAKTIESNAAELNEAIDRVNDLLFGAQDYAAVAVK